MEDRYAVEFDMTDELAARIARAVLADRRLFWRFGQMLGLPLLLLTVLLFWPTILVLRDSLSPLVIVAAVIVIGIVYWLLLSLLVRRYVCWTILLPFHGQARRTVRVIFSEEHIFMETGELSGERNWKELDAIQVFSGLWLFRLEAGGHLAVPMSALSPDLEALIRRKAAAAGMNIQE